MAFALIAGVTVAVVPRAVVTADASVAITAASSAAAVSMSAEAPAMDRVEKSAGEVGGLEKSNGPTPVLVTETAATAGKLKAAAAPRMRNTLDGFITTIVQVY